MPHGFRRPSPAMAVALLALVASTTGVGIAATQIDGANLKERSVSTPKLKIGAVRAAQLSTGAVTTTKLKAASVTAGKMARNAVTSAAIAPGEVRADDLAPGSVGGVQIADGSVLGVELGAGAVTEAKIANATVSRAKLTADALLPQVAVRRSALVNIPANSVGTVTATCATGERLSGGGATPSSGPVVDEVVISGLPSPNNDGDVPVAWVATVDNNTAAAQPVVAFAICLRAA